MTRLDRTYTLHSLNIPQNLPQSDLGAHTTDGSLEF